MHGVSDHRIAAAEVASVLPSQRVLIADSDPLFLRGLQVTLAGEFLIEKEVTTSGECLAAASQTEILVMGFSLACGRNALGLLPDLKLQLPGLAVVVLLSPTTGWMTQRLYAAGACGVLSRRTPSQELPGLLRDAILRRPLPPVLSHSPRESSTAGSVDLSVLTAREIEVFRLIGLQKSTKEMAALLGISEKTISAHRENLKAKLDLHGSEVLSLVAVSHATWEATGADYII